MYLNFRIKVPAIIERILTALLITYRRRRFGYGFMRIRLIGGQPVGVKPAGTRMSAEQWLVETNLTAARFAIVDPEDYEKICRDDWLLKENKNTCYAWRMLFKDGKFKIIYMHREIMQAPKGSIVDHQNREGLDNRKINLHFVNRRQNALNYTKRGRPCGSKYRGVCRDEERGKWRAYIHTELKPKHLGYFDSEEEAAKAYDEAAKKYYGEDAVLNFTTENAESTARIENLTSNIER